MAGGSMTFGRSPAWKMAPVTHKRATGNSNGRLTERCESRASFFACSSRCPSCCESLRDFLSPEDMKKLPLLLVPSCRPTASILECANPVAGTKRRNDHGQLIADFKTSEFAPPTTGLYCQVEPRAFGRRREVLQNHRAPMGDTRKPHAMKVLGSVEGDTVSRGTDEAACLRETRAAVPLEAATSTTVDLRNLLSLDDFQEAAREALGVPIYEYVASGTDDEQTLAENRAAFKRCFLRPLMMRNVSDIDTSCSFFGDRATMPIFISPAGVHKVVDPEGECATARAARDAGIIMGVSQHATTCLEDVAAAAPDGNRWFQTYIMRDRYITADLIKRAEKSGYSAIVLTVDSVVFGSREADARNGFDGLPSHLCLANYNKYGDRVQNWDDREEAAWDQNTEKLWEMNLSWDVDLKWLRSVTRLPILVKGVLRGDDASRAISAGADGIIVSNHGGRQLDGCLSSFEALPEVVEAVRRHTRGGDDFPVLLDSGVRRGTDVLKALALGAKAVLLGRSYLLVRLASPSFPCFLSLLSTYLVPLTSSQASLSSSD